MPAIYPIIAVVEIVVSHSLEPSNYRKLKQSFYTRDNIYTHNKWLFLSKGLSHTKLI